MNSIQNRNRKNQSRGFVLTELLLGVAVVAMLALIGAGVYQGLKAGINADDMGSKTIGMVSEIQKVWRNAGTYTTLTPAEIDKVSLVVSPMRMSGANLLDAWGNTMTLNGGQSSFALTIGGATAPINKDDCATIANKLASLSSIIRIGSSAAIGTGGSAGTVTGGNLFKSGATITQNSLTTGCNEANPVIAAQFR